MIPGANVLKLFMDVIYKWTKCARVFVLVKLFYPSLMYAGKGATQVGSSITPKHPTKLGKHATLAQAWAKSVNEDN
jgi:hypothetical protein